MKNAVANSVHCVTENSNCHLVLVYSIQLDNRGHCGSSPVNGITLMLTTNRAVSFSSPLLCLRSLHRDKLIGIYNLSQSSYFQGLKFSSPFESQITIQKLFKGLLSSFSLLADISQQSAKVSSCPFCYVVLSYLCGFFFFYKIDYVLSFLCIQRYILWSKNAHFTKIILENFVSVAVILHLSHSYMSKFHRQVVGWLLPMGIFVGHLPSGLLKV